MGNFIIHSLREHPEELERFISYFSANWGNPEIYRDCMTSALTAAGPLPQWYLAFSPDHTVIGGAGLIPNDFISRMDLTPWLCALRIEPSFRGYSVFGVGAEVAGITVSKIIAKWFKDKELALAMGVQVALARIGSQVAYAIAIPVARSYNLDTPLLIGAVLLLGGMISFIAFSFMDRKLDRQVKISVESSADEKFSFKDVVAVVKNPGFWLIALLCVLFYSCVFPFQKFATELMITKYGVNEEIAGTFAGLPALGALILTPVFGGMIDRKGKAASIMMLGSLMLICVHFIYAMPFIHAAWVAIALMIILGIAFSLVPSAMWPSVAKIFPVKQLGTAYALIFFIQNIGLWGVPALIGYILEEYCIVGTTTENGVTTNLYNYTLPMCVFTSIAVLSLVIAFCLKVADKKYGYKLEEPNLKK